MTEVSKENHHLLALDQIAYWQIPDIQIPNLNAKPKLKASIPSLQRGAVWEPQQIEMLWDSIMRGFPIGAIVVAERIKGQHDKQSTTSNKNNDDKSVPESTHHILDGQQRCNAIAWGFADPSNENLSDDIVLWLDLKPGDRLKNSVRKFLFRVTTKAHPWGFRCNDEAGNLTAGNMRDAMNEFKDIQTHTDSEQYQSGKDGDNKNKKPTPRFAFPYDAGLPVPVYLLLKNFDDKKLIGEKLNLDALKNEPMMQKILTVKKAVIDLGQEELELIENGLKLVKEARLVALQVPDLIQGIDDIEQIFQRLNRQGTPLDSEELAYSIIKAYWPEIERIIAKLPDNLRHITEARLVSLGVQIALSEQSATKLKPELTSDEIRKIFKEKDASESEHAEKIINFFEDKSDNPPFRKSLQWIDDNLLYKESTRSYGIPKYIRSSLAWRSRDVFAWLMLLAKQYEYQPITDDKAKRIIGISLTIHWFGEDKTGAINSLLKEHGDLPGVSISDLLKDNGNKKYIHAPLNLGELEAALQLDDSSTEQQLKNWKDFWRGVVERDKSGNKIEDEENALNSRKEKYEFIAKLKGQRELLLYAQRAYIERAFSDFDPSNKLMWKGHNRPWDYDHILPSNSIGGTGSPRQDYTEACQTWQNSIGNLTAIDFASNRAFQDKVGASKKYAKNLEGMLESDGFDIFCDDARLSAFEIKHTDTGKFEKSQDFVLAAKDRFVALYKNWYDAVEYSAYSDSQPLEK